jgi:hypothetical protein
LNAAPETTSGVTILTFAPDLVEKVFAGGMTLQQAAEIARPPLRH